MWNKKRIFLKVIFSAIGILEMAGGLFAIRKLKKCRQELVSERHQVNRHAVNYSMMLKSMLIHQRGRKLADFFTKKHYQKIAIYGAGEIGIMLFDEIRKNGVEVAYFIDSGAQKIERFADCVLREDAIVPVYPMLAEFPYVDALVITPVSIIEEIEKKLEGKIFAPMISLEEVIDDTLFCGES